MPIIANEAPPDGFYWFASSNPIDGNEVKIVKVYRSPYLDNIPRVLFHGTDVEQEWADLHGVFVPVAPPIDLKR